MSKRTIRYVSLFVIALLMVGALSGVHAQDKVTLTWFVGLGTGTDAQQIEAQESVVAEFNASQSEIELVLLITSGFDTGRDHLSTLIASGNSPDIVGPVGVGGSNAFADQWLNLQPLVDAAGFDLSVFDPALLELYRTADGGLSGIPFGVFPDLTYYNKSLFEEAGLEFPPATFDAPYVLDGEEVPWNYETLGEVAKILTVDANGNDATSPDFDPDNIVQFGLNFQWNGLRLTWTALQPEQWYDAESNTITIPESWRTATQWLYDAVWTDHFIPTATYSNSELFGTGNTLQSGNVAMVVVPLWYTCCLGGTVGNFEWDLAVVPQSLDGQYHVAMDADTFRIMEGSKNPEAAFTALTYLQDQGFPTLGPVYGAFPADPKHQQAWFDGKNEQYPWGVNWQVAIDSLAYNNPINLHHESDHPNWQKGQDRVGAFSTLLYGDTGVDMDVNAELDSLQADLQAIVEEQ
jgi:multiple sugar transport system substrate-binding protein